MIVKLKYDKSAEGEIEQIKKKQYTDCLKGFLSRNFACQNYL